MAVKCGGNGVGVLSKRKVCIDNQPLLGLDWRGGNELGEGRPLSWERARENEFE